MSNRKHFVDMASQSASSLTHLLTTIDELKQADVTSTAQTLQGKTIINCFFEPSTRTLCSFELAAKRLGATVINFNAATSSTIKGETLLDTMKTLDAMQVDAFVVRHSDNGVMEKLTAEFNWVSIVNAGDGTNEHPTQALLDIATIRAHKPDFKPLNVAIIGDIAHSRVAHSNIHALRILGAAEIRAIGPADLVPSSLQEIGATIYHDIDQGLRDADVVMALRIQRERMQKSEIPNDAEYFYQFGLTTDRLQLAKPDAIVMHPGPMNRNVEIASDVADGPQSVILEQVNNGVWARMAVLQSLLLPF